MQSRKWTGRRPELIMSVLKPSLWNGLLEDEHGQDLIEYALVTALLALGAVTTMRGLGTKIGSAFNSIGTTLTSSV